MESQQVIIRRPDADLFYTDEGRWTKKREEARAFNSVLDAFYFAAHHRLPEIQVMFQPQPKRLKPARSLALRVSR